MPSRQSTCGDRRAPAPNEKTRHSPGAVAGSLPADSRGLHRSRLWPLQRRRHAALQQQLTEHGCKPAPLHDFLRPAADIPARHNRITPHPFLACSRRPSIVDHWAFGRPFRFGDAHVRPSRAAPDPAARGQGRRTRAARRRTGQFLAVVAVRLCGGPGQPARQRRGARGVRGAGQGSGQCAAPQRRLRQPDRQRQAPGRAVRAEGGSERPAGAPAARRRLPDARTQGRTPARRRRQHAGRRRAAGRRARLSWTSYSASARRNSRSSSSACSASATAAIRSSARSAARSTRAWPNSVPRACSIAPMRTWTSTRVAKPWAERALQLAREQVKSTAPLATVTPLRPAATATWSREKPYSAEVIANQRLTGRGSDKDIRHIELSLEGLGPELRTRRRARPVAAQSAGACRRRHRPAAGSTRTRRCAWTKRPSRCVCGSASSASSRA